MPEIGEAVNLPEVSANKCPICDKAPHPDRTTEDKKQKKGCLASKPGDLGCAPIHKDSTLPNYTTAAHHVIPAIQCLASFARLSQMCETVGYNVNNPANGMSLPTCGQQALNSYASSSGAMMRYGRLDDSDKNDVAFLIMEGLKLQWHVGHHDWALDLKTDSEVHPVNYDQLVKRQLRNLERDIQSDGESICEPPDDSESGSALIAELNALSAQIKASVLAWALYYVSARSYKYFRKYLT